MKQEKEEENKKGKKVNQDAHAAALKGSSEDKEKGGEEPVLQQPELGAQLHLSLCLFSNSELERIFCFFNCQLFSYFV